MKYILLSITILTISMVGYVQCNMDLFGVCVGDASFLLDDESIPLVSLPDTVSTDRGGEGDYSTMAQKVQDYSTIDMMRNSLSMGSFMDRIFTNAFGFGLPAIMVSFGNAVSRIIHFLAILQLLGRLPVGGAA